MFKKMLKPNNCQSYFVSSWAKKPTNEAFLQKRWTADAQELEKNGKIQDALSLYTEANNQEATARCLERLFRYEEAVEKYQRIGMIEEAERCKQKHLAREKENSKMPHSESFWNGRYQ
ncbi:MAG TPA: hypothetical protein VGK74_00930 [Symbiobacteriaceae bacterium]